jgi:hypothetical protein|eukprot:COSAG06_NODE_12181_length_1412_cov_1.757807_3_plen_95_part_00
MRTIELPRQARNKHKETFQLDKEAFPAGTVTGPGLTHDEAIAHMSLWVMAASPLLACTDPRNMSAATKAIWTNPEVLDIHKDPLARMGAKNASF